MTNGSSSDSTSLPSSALATPAPSSSATWITSAAAPRAPCPTRMATLLPALSTSAARTISASSATTVGATRPGSLEGTCLKACSGGE